MSSNRKPFKSYNHFIESALNTWRMEFTMFLSQLLTSNAKDYYLLKTKSNEVENTA